MKRDFTSEAEENILDYCNMHEEDETWSPVETFGTIKIEEYLMNSDDINYCMNNIEIHHAMYMESQLYNEQFVHDVFADVRECDHQYAVIAEDYRVNAMDYYIESMKALYESIRVTAPGESSVSLQQIANARETYGRYGEVDGNCSSIFNNTGSFNNAIQSAGDGAITPTVQRIEENGGIEALAMKSADDITMWEVAAVSKMVDACTYMENGELYINYEQLSGLLSRMYVEVDGSYWGGVNQPDAMIEGRMKYETSAILELLNGYRTAIGNNITNKYGYYMYIDQTDSSLNTEEIKYARSVLNTETTISDLIFALCENGDISVSLGYPNSVRGEAERKSLELSISELESGDISITSNGTGCEAIIYTISGSLREECVEADNRWFLAQLVNPWEKLVFDVAASGFDSAVGAVPVVGNIYGYIKDGYGIYQSFDENKKNNENLHTVVRNNNLQLYLESMHCGGTVVSLGDTYVVRNLIVDKNALTVDVAFYNAHNKDTDLTPDMLMNELNNYIEGKDDCDNLAAFCGYGNGDEDVNGSLLAAHDNYEHNVCQYLIEEYNVYTSEATAEQLEEAINAVDDGWTAVNNN